MNKYIRISILLAGLLSLTACNEDDQLDVVDIDIPRGYMLSAGTSTGFYNSSVAYDQAAAQAKKATQDYNYALKMNASDAKAADGSYNSLVATMGRLKQEWRATGDEMKRAELGKQINNINNQLRVIEKEERAWYNILV